MKTNQCKNVTVDTNIFPSNSLPDLWQHSHYILQPFIHPC